MSGSLKLMINVKAEINQVLQPVGRLEIRILRMKLGSLILKSKIILSPMEAVSDCGFRRLCYNQGAGLCWTEMVRAQGILKKNRATLDLIDTFDPDVPTGVQLLVRSGEELTKCLKRIENLANGVDTKKEKVDESPSINTPECSGNNQQASSNSNTSFDHFKNISAIDINFGCPSPDIINEGYGPAMLKRQKKLEEILSSLVYWKNNCSLSIGAVGCKIRLGLSSTEQDNKIYLRAVEAANKAGIDYLVVHARHAKQKSRDKPTWACIEEVTKVATMPVIGNGDVFSEQDIHDMMSLGCKGVMVARAPIRNPWCLTSFAKQADIINLSGVSWKTKEQWDAQSWPTENEVDIAWQDYSSFVSQCPTKPKYVEFHRKNFERIRKAAHSQDFTAKVGTPRTAHLP